MICKMRYELPQCLAAAIRGLLGSIWLESPHSAQVVHYSWAAVHNSWLYLPAPISGALRPFLRREVGESIFSFIYLLDFTAPLYSIHVLTCSASRSKRVMLTQIH
jgi:hypothetical protein